MLFTVIADVSILTLNLSLMLNTVSFYQVGAAGAWLQPRRGLVWYPVAVGKGRAGEGGDTRAAMLWRRFPAAAAPDHHLDSPHRAPLLHLPSPTSSSPAARAHPPATSPATPPHPTPPPQIAKLLIIPFVCFVESSFLGRTFSQEVVGSILLVIVGVAVVSGAAAGGGGWGATSQRCVALPSRPGAPLPAAWPLRAHLCTVCAPQPAARREAAARLGPRRGSFTSFPAALTSCPACLHLLSCPRR